MPKIKQRARVRVKSKSKQRKNPDKTRRRKLAKTGRRNARTVPKTKGSKPAGRQSKPAGKPRTSVQPRASGSSARGKAKAIALATGIFSFAAAAGIHAEQMTQRQFNEMMQKFMQQQKSHSRTASTTTRTPLSFPEFQKLLREQQAEQVQKAVPGARAERQPAKSGKKPTAKQMADFNYRDTEFAEGDMVQFLKETKGIGLTYGHKPKKPLVKKRVWKKGKGIKLNKKDQVDVMRLAIALKEKEIAIGDIPSVIELRGKQELHEVLSAWLGNGGYLNQLPKPVLTLVKREIKNMKRMTTLILPEEFKRLQKKLLESRKTVFLDGTKFPKHLHSLLASVFNFDIIDRLGRKKTPEIIVQEALSILENSHLSMISRIPKGNKLTEKNVLVVKKVLAEFLEEIPKDIKAEERKKARELERFNEANDEIRRKNNLAGQSARRSGKPFKRIPLYKSREEFQRRKTVSKTRGRR